MNFEKAREEMIRYQIKGRGIRDKRVLSAMSSIPRDKFVLEGEEYNAYLDCPLPIGMGQTISQPFMVALMTQCLSLKGSETVLLDPVFLTLITRTYTLYAKRSTLS